VAGDSRDIPQGRFFRLARLAGAGLRASVGAFVEKRPDAAAERTAELLGSMRGLAAKVGQMTGYVDGLVPEAQREAYERAMKPLLAAAPRSSPAEIRRLLEGELDAPVDRLFARFDDVPVASASIGQVHRAALFDGREVAVKVQHPGVARAMEADLANAGLLEHAAGLLGGARFDMRTLLATVRERFREELDYLLEAERYRLFARLHADDPVIVIPEVVPSRSGPPRADDDLRRRTRLRRRLPCRRGRAAPRGRGALAVRLQGHQRRRRLQRRPAPRQLPLPAGRPHRLPRFRLRPAHRRRPPRERPHPPPRGDDR
jgi:hypothetical protein